MFMVDSEFAESVDCVLDLMSHVMETYNLVLRSSKSSIGVVMLTNISAEYVRTIIGNMDICDVITVGGVTISRIDK